MIDSRYERELIYIDREIQNLLLRLERRRSKTLGKEDAERYHRVVRTAYDMVKMTGSLNRYDPMKLHMIRDALELHPASSRQKGIEILRNVSDSLSSVKTSISDRRVLELEGQVKKLQAQITDLLTSPEEETPPSAPDRTSVDVSDPNSVFVIMPFSETFNDVWTGGVLRAAKAEDFNPIRVDMIDRSSNITDDIIESVDKCQLAIVDVTDNNPNVMFELGYALAKAKNHIIISQSAEFLPFDIRQIRTIVYANTWSGIEELNRRIQDFLKEFKKKTTTKTKIKKTPKKK